MRLPRRERIRPARCHRARSDKPVLEQQIGQGKRAHAGGREKVAAREIDGFLRRDIRIHGLLTGNKFIQVEHHPTQGNEGRTLSQIRCGRFLPQRQGGQFWIRFGQ
jgi:hypothetical protein